MRYVVITGGVLSGIGKGTIASSLCHLLSNSGVKTSAMKIDPYLNYDAGTMNPYQHGEVFVLDDGSESDLDLGNYERYLDRNLNGDSSITTGKVYKEVIEKELKDWLNSEIILELVDRDQLKKSIRESVNLIVNGEKNFLAGSTIDSMARKLAFQIAEKLGITEFLGGEVSITTHFRRFTVFDDQHEDSFFSLYEKEMARKEKENLSSPIFIIDPIKSIDKVISEGKRIEGTAHEIDKIIKEDKIISGLKRFNFNNLVFEGVEDDVSMDSMGDGFKALIGILASLYQQPKNTIVLIEEPEVHMHPGYLQELAKYLILLSRTRNIQLFISTHSMELINCFLDIDLMPPLNSDFVKSEFFMLRLNQLENVVVSEEIDYNEADMAIKELEWDLRGI